ncbi:hypothetical protein PIB30_009105 [Stylosanthes scabra]|uniref:Uncharacterized protein n=1 Tax=Stylosanthes scabra TaxID=79078 RepID=A0ABU6W3Q6_9FABA|nr:hypothetical protein [Stylosanthes scabra]
MQFLLRWKANVRGFSLKGGYEDIVSDAGCDDKFLLRTYQNVSLMFSYHRGIASVFAIELCVQMQDVGGSSSSSNHVESGRGITINEGARMPANHRTSSPSPSFSPYINRPVQHPPPEVPHFEDHDGAFTIHSLETDDAQAGGLIATVVMMTNLFRKHNHLLLNRSWTCQPLQLY